MKRDEAMAKKLRERVLEKQRSVGLFAGDSQDPFADKLKEDLSKSEARLNILKKPFLKEIRTNRESLASPPKQISP